MVGFTCHAPLQHCLHENMLTAELKEKKTEGKDEKQERTFKGLREMMGEQLKKQTAMLHIFRAKSKVSRRGKKVSYIFLDVWSEPKGPPLQGHNAIKHSEMKCLIGGDKGRRGGREGSNRGCSKASKMKARAAPCWEWRRWLG